MTEFENSEGQKDICFVNGKPTEGQAKKIGLFDFATYADYVASHTDVEGVYDNSLTEDDFNTYKSQITTGNGNPDFTFGRPIKMTLRDVAEGLSRIETLEAQLCLRDGSYPFC